MCHTSQNRDCRFRLCQASKTRWPLFRQLGRSAIPCRPGHPCQIRPLRRQATKQAQAHKFEQAVLERYHRACMGCRLVNDGWLRCLFRRAQRGARDRVLGPWEIKPPREGRPGLTRAFFGEGGRDGGESNSEALAGPYAAVPGVQKTCLQQICPSNRGLMSASLPRASELRGGIS